MSQKKITCFKSHSRNLAAGKHRPGTTEAVQSKIITNHLCIITPHIITINFVLQLFVGVLFWNWTILNGEEKKRMSFLLSRKQICINIYIYIYMCGLI